MGRIGFTLIKLEGKHSFFNTWEHNMTKQGEHKLTDPIVLHAVFFLLFFNFEGGRGEVGWWCFYRF